MKGIKYLFIIVVIIAAGSIWWYYMEKKPSDGIPKRAVLVMDRRHHSNIEIKAAVIKMKEMNRRKLLKNPVVFEQHTETEIRCDIAEKINKRAAETRESRTELELS